MNREKHRIVVKVGTSTLTRGQSGINFRALDRLTRVLAERYKIGGEAPASAVVAP